MKKLRTYKVKSNLDFLDNLNSSFILIISESVLNIKVNEYKLLENELPVTNFKKYHMTTDIVLKVDNELIVNIEINRTYFKHSANKSPNSNVVKESQNQRLFKK